MSKYAHMLLLFSILAVTWQRSEAKPFFIFQKSFYVLPASAPSVVPVSTTASPPTPSPLVYNAASQQQLFTSLLNAKLGLLSNFLALKGGVVVSAPETTTATTTTTTPSPPEINTVFTPTEPRKEDTNSKPKTDEVAVQGGGYSYASTTEESIHESHGAVPSSNYLPPHTVSNIYLPPHQINIDTNILPPHNDYLPPHRFRY